MFFGETVGACDMPKSLKFPSLESCQNRFLWTYKALDLAPHPVVDLVLQVGDVGKCPKALGFGSLDQFLTASKQGPCFTATEEDGGDQVFVEFELSCEVDGVAPPGPV